MEFAAKFVYWPAINTDTLSPADAEFGVSELIFAAGLTVSVARLPLANVEPASVFPDIDTKYAEGEPTLIDAGIKNVTRRVLPVTVATDVACVVTGDPEPDGLSVTVTFAGEIVPLGKFDPVTDTVVTPGSPELGTLLALSVTVVCA